MSGGDGAWIANERECFRVRLRMTCPIQPNGPDKIFTLLGGFIFFYVSSRSCGHKSLLFTELWTQKPSSQSCGHEKPSSRSCGHKSLLHGAVDTKSLLFTELWTRKAFFTELWTRKAFSSQSCGHEKPSSQSCGHKSLLHRAVDTTKPSSRSCGHEKPSEMSWRHKLEQPKKIVKA